MNLPLITDIFCCPLLVMDTIHSIYILHVLKGQGGRGKGNCRHPAKREKLKKNIF